jgi:hypothetical protein
VLGLNQCYVPIPALATVMIADQALLLRHSDLINNSYRGASFGPDADPLDPARLGKHFE